MKSKQKRPLSRSIKGRMPDKIAYLAFIYEKVSFKYMSKLFVVFYDFIICKENEEIMFLK